MAHGADLVGAPFQHAMLDEMGQPLGQDAAGNPEPRLEIIKSAHFQESLAQDHQGPAITDHRQGAGERALLL